MKSKNVICFFSFIFVFSVSIFLVVFSYKYLAVLRYSVLKVQSMKIYYNGGKYEKTIENISDQKRILNVLKKTKVKRIDFTNTEECGGDAGWSLVIKHSDGFDVFDYDDEIKNIDESACRRWTKSSFGKVEGLTIILGKDFINEINGIISD